MTKKKIVFIHGLWIHRSSWQPWMDFFEQNGYDTCNPGWPGSHDTVAQCRANPQAMANHGVQEVVDSYAALMATFDTPPVVVGHSFGGLIAQILLARRLASAAVAIDPAPMKGVWQLPWPALKAALPVIGNPFNLRKALSLTFPQFRYGFANAVSEREARELYERWTIPSPCRPVFQAAMANLTGTATQVNTHNTARGPLLITGGEMDHQVPPVLGRASLAKYPSSLDTEFKLFEGRGHSLVVDSGWQDIAQYSLAWLQSKGF